jgi:hypothetical protein
MEEQHCSNLSLLQVRTHDQRTPPQFGGVARPSEKNYAAMFTPRLNHCRAIRLQSIRRELFQHNRRKAQIHKGICEVRFLPC